MEKIIYRKTLDVHKSGVQFTLQGFETADKLSRVIEISLMASGDTVDFPLEKIVASMYVTTPSASTPSINACTIKDNKIIYEVLPITEEGTTIMQLKIAETSITGAKSILVTPKFAVEVAKSNADDESAEQTTTFTALENATAKANAVYDGRLLKVEVTKDLTFRAIYADGTEYESTAIREGVGSTLLAPKGEYDANTQYEPFDIVIDGDKAYLAIKSSVGVATSNAEYWNDIFSFNKTLADNYANLNNEAIAQILKDSSVERSSDLKSESLKPTIVTWDAETSNTPYSEGLTTVTKGFAIICGDEYNHTISAWCDGDINTYTASTTDGEYTGFYALLSEKDLSHEIKFGTEKEGRIGRDAENGTYFGDKNTVIKIRENEEDVALSKNNVDYPLLGTHNFNEIVSSAGYAKIASGTYVGTGKAGQSSPTTIEVKGFTPKLIYIDSMHTQADPTGYNKLMPMLFSPHIPSTEYGNRGKTIFEYSGLSNSSEESIYKAIIDQWWNEATSAVYLAVRGIDSSDEPWKQMNMKGETYLWVAIG